MTFLPNHLVEVFIDKDFFIFFDFSTKIIFNNIKLKKERAKRCLTHHTGQQNRNSLHINDSTLKIYQNIFNNIFLYSKKIVAKPKLNIQIFFY